MASRDSQQKRPLTTRNVAYQPGGDGLQLVDWYTFHAFRNDSIDHDQTAQNEPMCCAPQLSI